MEDSQQHETPSTGVDRSVLKEVASGVFHYPETLRVHPRLAKVFASKREAVRKGIALDWSIGELLAYGTLLREGYPVRLSGQDSIRGTFSHRHAHLIDQENEERYCPLNHHAHNQAGFEVINSNLSEFAVLGFEHGYSLSHPNCLTIWEAQFGDFSNGAQVIIDQFIASSEKKWLRMSGLVLLLPHGYEGQGPEHSSARLERYLQSCAEDNIQVVNVTNPANFFHVLRRQLHRTYRKPLIVMSPKSLLRHEACVSPLDDFAEGTCFLPLIPESDPSIDMGGDQAIRKVILCSGKVYYDLCEQRKKEEKKTIAILRLEQFYPFPEQELEQELSRYPNASLVWCQEEPRNMGGWFFVDRRIETVMVRAGMKAERPIYAGRLEAAAPAAGYMKIHKKRQQALLEQALLLE